MCPESKYSLFFVDFSCSYLWILLTKQCIFVQEKLEKILEESEEDAESQILKHSLLNQSLLKGSVGDETSSESTVDSDMFNSLDSFQSMLEVILRIFV